MTLIKYFTSALFIVLLSTFVYSQSPTPTPPDDEGDIVKISTNLIQIDVTAVDKNGKQVTDLKPEDFEVYENGKKQTITNFSYIPILTETRKEISVKPTTNNQKNLPPVPIKLKPEQVRRTVAIVIDDLGLSFFSLRAAKATAKKFVNEQMQPNDLVGIITTRSGAGALQQFTSDKRLLLMAIDKIKLGSGKVYAFMPYTDATQKMRGVSDAPGVGGVAPNSGSPTESDNPSGPVASPEYRENVEDFRRSAFTSGTLGAMNYLINGMNELPGRKAIILFSEGFDILGINEPGQLVGTGNKAQIMREVKNGLDQISESANRAGVIINAIDARGLDEPLASGDAEDATPAAGTTAAGFIAGREQVSQNEAQRSRQLRSTQSGLKYLAEATGGRALVNSNDFSGGVERSVNDLNGYYLVAYQPDENTFDTKKSRFNKIDIKINRPDVKVTYRSGFFGVPDNVVKSEKKDVSASLFSPFGVKDIDLSLTSVFANDVGEGNVVRALLNIDAKNLKFADDPNGGKIINVELYAHTFDEKGKSVDSSGQRFEITLNKERYQKVLSEGLTYMMSVPVKNPGAYQLRLAVRDINSAKVGSASQFIEVPNLTKNQLALSGLLLQKYTSAEWETRNQNTDAAKMALNIQSSTANRKFSNGDVIQFRYVVYNAKSSSNSLKAQARLVRDGEVVFNGKVVPLNTKGAADQMRLESNGAVALGKDMIPGDYILQLVVFDDSGKEKNKITSQSIDFEIVQ